MILLAFSGVQSSTEDGFTSVRTFFSCNVLLSAEFFPKTLILLRRSPDIISKNLSVDVQNPEIKFILSVNLTFYLRTFITKKMPTSAKCCRIHPTWNMTQFTPPCHFCLSFNQYRRLYPHKLANSTPRQKIVLPSLVGRRWRPSCYHTFLPISLAVKILAMNISIVEFNFGLEFSGAYNADYFAGDVEYDCMSVNCLCDNVDAPATSSSPPKRTSELSITNSFGYEELLVRQLSEAWGDMWAHPWYG